MKRNSSPSTAPPFHLLEERYGGALFASVGLHAALVAFVLYAPLIFPSPAPIRLGSGSGGGLGDESYAVGVADDLGGGFGTYKPSPVPQPPALLKEEPPAQNESKAIPLDDVEPPKKTSARDRERMEAERKKRPQDSTVIPTAPQPGAGGSGGLAAGSGGGRGGGTGVSIGSGSGGVGDSWYARVVESRISSNWLRPTQGTQVDIVYSFYIAENGVIYQIKREKSSGNEALDLAAERAIRASNPLAPPPPEFRGRPIQFVAQFVYPQVTP